MKARTFWKKGSVATRVWKIWVVKDTVYYESGQLDGKMVTSSRKGEGKNRGRANEVTPAADAENWAERQIELKTRQGYREVGPQGKLLEEAAQSLNFDDARPPENYRIYKPLNNLNVYLQKKLEGHTAWALRKRNGNGMVVYVDSRANISMYTLTMQASHQNEDVPYLERFPHLLKELKALKLPRCSMICGELVTCNGVNEGDYPVDDLDLVNSVRGSMTSEALEVQKEWGNLGFAVWDIAWWDRECWLRTKTYRERFDKIRLMLRTSNAMYLTYPELCFCQGNNVVIDSLGVENEKIPVDSTVEKTLLDFAVKMGWEGYVVVDPGAPYGDKADNFKGKADRPKFTGKLKPSREGDFIVRWDPDNGIGRRGKGKKAVGVGSLQAYLMHPEKGEIEVCLVGGGLTDELVLELADPSIYPKVAQIEFADWTKDGSLQFPEFVRFRDDKLLDECSVEQNPDWEEHYG